MSSHVSTAKDWIKHLQLVPHPEGGYYRETYRSEEVVESSALSGRFQGVRVFSTAIYFLLEREQCSMFHRLASDEIWHFYAGDGLCLHVIDPHGNYEKFVVGRQREKGESLQLVVPAGHWFGATVVQEGEFSLVGCTVAPGFDFEDFEIGSRDKLTHEFPKYKEIIEKLTRI